MPGSYFQRAEDFIPKVSRLEYPRHITVEEVEEAFRWISLAWHRQWQLTGRGHCERVIIKKFFVKAACNGSNCWLYTRLAHIGGAKYIFPADMVRAVCYYLEIPYERLMERNVSGDFVPVKKDYSHQKIVKEMEALEKKEPGWESNIPDLGEVELTQT